MSYRDLFRTYNDENVRYVVPRRHDNLPEGQLSDDGDVDILVSENDFERAIGLSKELGFSAAAESSSSRFRMVRGAIYKPKKATERLRQNPITSIRDILTGTSRYAGNARHTNRKLYRGSQMIDLRDNLAYESPMDGSRIPVDLSVTEGMLARRIERDGLYVPSPADELAHLVSHCVFNKNGTFPPYYSRRCEDLFNDVRSDAGQLGVFRELLEQIFFDADELVFELLAEGRYSDIRSELKSFHDY
jgi:hypothetical protein